MSIVATALQTHSVPDEVKGALTTALGREDLGQHLFDLVKSVADLGRRVAVLEHPGSSPALVSLAVQIVALREQLAIAEAREKERPGTQAPIIASLREQILAAIASARQAMATPADVSPVLAVLQELLAFVAPAPVATPPSTTSTPPG